MYTFISSLQRSQLISTLLALVLIQQIIPTTSLAQTNVVSGASQTPYALTASAVIVDPQISVSGNSAISGFKVTISSGKKSGDVLSYTATLPGGISASFNSNTGVLTFNGSANSNEWQSILRSVTFSNNISSQYGDRTITFSAGTLAAAFNGHYYELVSSPLTWTSAKTAAESRNYLGYTGYLATITSDAENTFIRQVLASDSWIGASDDYTQINAATGTTSFANQSAAEGKWYWVTGPEKGLQFSNGNLSPVTITGGYANWNGAEPNNSGSNEHYGQIYSSNATGRWNDLPNSFSITYVVEYGGLLSDPVQNITSNTTVYTIIGANTITGSQVRCYGTNTGTLTGLTPTGGNGSYTYQWISSTVNATSGFTAAAGSSMSVNYNPGALNTTTWYRRVVTSGTQVDTSAAVEVTVYPQLSVSPTTNNVLCANETSGTVTLSATGGTSPFNYTWNDGNNSSARNNLGAGNYTCLITDAAGCTVSTSVTITEPSALDVSSTQSSPLCFGDASATISINTSGGTSPYQFAWSAGNGTNSFLSNINAGTYTCTITDANGCSAEETITINQPIQLQISSLQITDVRCNRGNDGEIQLTASGGTGTLIYNWNTGDIVSTISNLTAGQYECTITDANGCTATTLAIVNEPTAIQASVNKIDVACHGGSTGEVLLTATGGIGAYGFQWSNGLSSDHETGLPAGNYTITITDQNGCATQELVSILEPSALLIDSTNATHISCFGANDGSVIAFASGGTTPYTFIWNGVPSNASSISQLSAGQYQLLIQDGNGCEISQNVNLTEPTQLQLTLQSSAATCGQSNGTAFASVSNTSSTVNFNWSNGSTANVLNNILPGTYTVIAVDSFGCSITDSILVGSFDAPTLNTAVTDATCFGEFSGSVQLTITSSAPVQSILWSNGAVSADLTQLAAGTYSYTVQDVNGCITSGTATINEPEEILLSANVTSAAGGANGSIDLSVEPFGANYAFAWDNGEVTEDINGLQPGDYTVVVTNPAGCTSTLSTVVGSITGIAGINSENSSSLSVFPNPNNGVFNVRSTEAGMHQLLNANGQVVNEFYIGQNNTEQLNFNTLSSGLYFLKSASENQTESVRIVIQNQH